MAPGAGIDSQRGDTVICIAGGTDPDQLSRCLDSVARHTVPEIQVIVRPAAEFRDAVAASAPADLVWLSADRVVAGDWLGRMRSAAYLDSRVASATALTNDGFPGEVAVPGDGEYDRAAALVACGSARIRPRVPEAGAHCVYLRRSALELVGDFADLRDFSMRCAQRNLFHVLADDVLVLAPDRRPDEPEHPAPVQPRFDPLQRSLSAVRRSLEGLSIAVDARILAGPESGTKLHVLELIGALGAVPGHRVHAIVPAGLDAPTRELLSDAPGVEVIGLPRGPKGDPGFRADIVHRPYQINSPADLNLLARLGDRLVVTQQDLIAYDSRVYFRSPEAWERYRELTQTALATVDRVLFFSAHARDEALAEDLVEAHRTSVVHIGVDHRITRPMQSPVSPPRRADEICAAPEMMLCIGADYQHKNRTFALRVLDALQRRHEWRGVLVLAGPHVEFGSSREEEAGLLHSNPRLADAVIDLEEVSEPEKQWLFEHASVVIYPSVHEGFGLVPFEAAGHGVPCLWSPGTSLSELLPDHAAAIIPWDPEATAAAAVRLLRDERARSENVGDVRGAAEGLRWETTASRLIDVYGLTCAQPPTPVAALARTEGVMNQALSEDAVRLVGPDGALPRELERPLLALSNHPRLGRPVLGALKAGYQLSRRWRLGRSPAGQRRRS